MNKKRPLAPEAKDPADPSEPADPVDTPFDNPAAEDHDDWLLDESLKETFPSSDPISPSPPKE